MAFWHTVRFWGTRPEEREGEWPCDARARPGEVSLFRAVDVDAPPAVVFRWLCQLKVAPYSYDWIDNLGRRSPRRLTEGVDRLEVGQRFMSIFALREFAPDRFLTLESRGLGPIGPVLVTYQTHPLRALDDEGMTRLLARLRWVSADNFVGRTASRTLALGDWVMMRKQLLTLKACAEKAHAREPENG